MTLRLKSLTGLTVSLVISGLVGCSATPSTDDVASSPTTDPALSSDTSVRETSAGQVKGSETFSETSAVDDTSPQSVPNPPANEPAPTPTTLAQAAPASPTNHTSLETSLDGDTIEPTTIASVALAGLANEKGRFYGEVRELMLRRGWVPHTFTGTNGPPSDANDSRVLAMEALGYLEVKTCSGSGQVFCRFEFVFEDRTAENAPVLVVTTAANPDNSQDPTFWDYSLENVSDLSYVDRAFDQSLFSQLRDNTGFCLGVGQCEQVQFMLNDALLVGGSGDFGSTRVSLFLSNAVSKAEALSYARILDVGGVIDFSAPRTEDDPNSESPNSETYYETGFPPEGASEWGGVSFIQLKLLPSGEVVEISFNTMVF